MILTTRHESDGWRSRRSAAAAAAGGNPPRALSAKDCILTALAKCPTNDLDLIAAATKVGSSLWEAHTDEDLRDIKRALDGYVFKAMSVFTEHAMPLADENRWRMIFETLKTSPPRGV